MFTIKMIFAILCLQGVLSIDQIENAGKEDQIKTEIEKTNETPLTTPINADKGDVALPLIVDVKEEPVLSKVNTAVISIENTEPQPQVQDSVNKSDTLALTTHVPVMKQEIVDSGTTSKITYSSLYMILIIFVTVVVTFLIASSAYYRYYLQKRRTPPFNAPDFLSLFYPKPINYENEITILCSKYMNN